ncbi:MAG: lipopolysaccharide biosynthesis protein [Muribaculaceae bacterium]
MGQTLKSRFVNGVIWGFIDRFATLGIGFIITIFLARQLSPEDYGLINMLTIFMTLGAVLIQSGFGHALIQKQHITDGQKCTVFYLNVCISIIIFVIGYFAAPLIANFYRQPELTSISRHLFILFPINAFSIIQHSILIKELKVKEKVIATTVALVVAGIVGIYLALNGFGVWSLVWQSITYAFTRCTMLWAMTKWVPKLTFDFKFVKEIYKFSLSLLGIYIVEGIFQNIYPIIIGKFFPVAQVGYYSQAHRLQTTISNSLSSAIQTVSFPAIASVQDDMERVRNLYKKMLTCILYIYIPAMALMCIMGREIFIVIFTSKWLLSVPIFMILCVAESLTPIAHISASVVKGLGKGKLYFWIEMFIRILILLSLVLFLNKGIIYMLIGYAAVMTVSSLLYLILTCSAIKYNVNTIAKELIPISIFTLMMSLAILPIKYLVDNPLHSLIICSLLGTTIYLITSYIFKYTALYELKNVLKKNNK